MIERQKRLNEVYQYLRQHRGIHTKSDFAESVHYGRTSMSAALNGNESYLTDSLFKNICDAFPHTFNLQYLLTGEGELITVEAHHGDKPEYEVNIIDIYSHLIADLELIRRETKKELAEIRTIKSELQQAQQQLIEAAETFRRINHQYNYPTVTTSKAAEESPTNN